MGRKSNKHGLPKNLDPDSEDFNPEGYDVEQSPKEFVEEFFADGARESQDTKGLPPLTWLKEQFKTKSACIRYLVNQEFQIKDIAKHLGIKYQHVRNVATSQLKRGPNEDWRPKSMREHQVHHNDGKASDPDVEV